MVLLTWVIMAVMVIVALTKAGILKITIYEDPEDENEADDGEENSEEE